MPCSGARAPRSLGTHPPKKVPTFADYLVFGGAAVDGAPGTFPQVILTRHPDLPRSRERCRHKRKRQDLEKSVNFCELFNLATLGTFPQVILTPGVQDHDRGEN